MMRNQWIQWMEWAFQTVDGYGRLLVADAVEEVGFGQESIPNPE
jgi:hypothetical protein